VATTGTTGEADVLASFGAPTRTWFEAAFAEPTPAQVGAWRAIAAGRNALVVAPTGSGKTLSAFLWSLDRLAATPPPEERLQRCRVLYVSPLKALAVDVERNLRAPLAGIRHTCDRLGVPAPDITVGLRSGDTTAADRRRLGSAPPDILITTPESLFLMLTSQARESLRGVETVVLDEVHAVAGTKRGAHLALSLERLDELRRQLGREPAQRIGLSATVRPVDEVARFLGGSRPVEVVAPGSAKQWDLTVVVPVQDMTELALAADVDEVREGSTAGSAERHGSIWPHVEERVVDLVEQHRSTIVFANSRRLAERLTARLNEIAADRAAAPSGADAPATSTPDRSVPAQLMGQAGQSAGSAPVIARAHHGSVSKEQRALIEDDLKLVR
jgi:ATP-dependent helicase Lhr and Lhr-like helicase